MNAAGLCHDTSHSTVGTRLPSSTHFIATNTADADIPAGIDAVLMNGLARASSSLASRGVPVPPLKGKLLRPRFALAMVPTEKWAELDDRFWMGALAIQMVHEASLIHDDVMDEATTRRGSSTVQARHGVAAAVVLGDHYLTGAYRAAAATGSLEFLDCFTTAVERTVAGEVAQGRATGRRMSPAEYDEAIAGKSGQLFGAAGFLAGAIGRAGRADERQCLGIALGMLYQRLDDLLDYCAEADTGKEPLQDYRQGKWSWVLELAGLEDFGCCETELPTRLFASVGDTPSPARQALEVLREQERKLLFGASQAGATAGVVAPFVRTCVAAAERGVTVQEESLRASPATALRASAESAIRAQMDSLGGPREWRAYFAEHAKTFRLAARLFPPREASLVSGLYAYCRFTDDLVDDPVDEVDTDVLAARLSVWREMTLAAYDGERTGLPLLDSVLGQAADHGVFRIYPEALLEGVGMDLTPRRYRTWSELERYTFGVAGSVGGWMTQLMGIHDPELLRRAHALGDAMQLTNIARDVGEDLSRGRLYLPNELLNTHSLSVDDLRAMAGGAAPISDGYRACVRDLLARADRYYESAWPGIRALPDAARRPVAAAAAAYRGIHREIRRNGYDNLTQRGHTSTLRKLVLAGSGLIDSRQASSGWAS